MCSICLGRRLQSGQLWRPKRPLDPLFSLKNRHRTTRAQQIGVPGALGHLPALRHQLRGLHPLEVAVLRLPVLTVSQAEGGLPGHRGPKKKIGGSLAFPLTPAQYFKGTFKNTHPWHPLHLETVQKGLGHLFEPLPTCKAWLKTKPLGEDMGRGKSGRI